MGMDEVTRDSVVSGKRCGLGLSLEEYPFFKDGQRKKALQRRSIPRNAVEASHGVSLCESKSML